MNDCAVKPVIDETGLQRLKDALAAAFPDMVEACLTDVDGACARMADAARHADGAEVKRAAHELAGVLGQFACPRAACMSRVIGGLSESDALIAAEAAMDAAKMAAAELAARAAGD